MPATLNRKSFTTSRALEFFTERELQAQSGLPARQWPLMVVKELADNGIDACEGAGILPQLQVTVSDDLIEVADNGPGLPRETLKRQLDFGTRTSTNTSYVSPTRGQQGNALKTVLAAPFVLDDSQGRVEVATAEYAVTITVRVDPLRQEPVIDVVEAGAPVKNGTLWRVHWPVQSSTIVDDEIGPFLSALAAMNPHLTVVLNGERVASRTQDTIKKWLPSMPTSPHWYSAADLTGLIAGYLTAEDDRTLREFVREFAGLSSTTKAKRVLDAADLAGNRLSDLLLDGDLDRDRIDRLLREMERSSKPVRPEKLGVIGRDQIREALNGLGGDPDTFRYKRIAGEEDGIPFLVEAAFAYCPDADERQLITGINWTPTYRDPFTALGEYGDSLSGVLGDEYAGWDEPIIVFVHLATPKPPFTDRGKTAMSLEGSDGEASLAAVQNVISPWSKQRRQEEREAQARLRRRERLARKKNTRIPWLETMLEVMPDAYRHVAGEIGVAEARQLRYAARPRLQELTGRTFDDQYLSYTLLPKFQQLHPELTADWNVVYDQRGHLVEPHTDRRVPLSTLGVRGYLDEVRSEIPDLNAGVPSLSTEIDTVGPIGRYQAIIFCEKEGMLPILQRAGIPQRYDVALMTTKGNTVTAARELVDSLTLMLADLEETLPILVLHDFDVTGLTILATFLKNSDRYEYRSRLHVIDAGLRLVQAQELQLQDEAVVFSRTSNGKFKTPKAETLRKNTASEEEIEYLIGDGRQGRRVELNTLTSDQYAGLVEATLAEHGLNQKVIPDQAQIVETYQQICTVHRLNALVAQAVEKSRQSQQTFPIPKTLAQDIARLLVEHPTWSWDRAASELASQKWNGRSRKRKRR